ncbi:acetyl-CoA carboxylase biotin carboxyl carrier protein [Candidatus Pantoea floridensis]|uniref:Acetyl-CoA carboxylase biotin carboxyl carrier protein n=1 Tax=Candidatus Pantoea floridensis TaxID=1938870 RepID=A0A286BSB1_9GAMM|nr:biotin/lipoyl-containing protein [Pantoea floridensis]PIF23592.1 acetyl-CoA carboxylase biotin carboxyl carrier protein [Enterobacteriaceae bacterium JKS000233]SOD37045.1 acetyl-CoA carboxylase biotin carboxyl carrier protein [Pantoea floridensis]
MDKTAIPLPTLRALARKMQTAGLSSLALDGKHWSVRLTFAATPSAPSPVSAMVPSPEISLITQRIGAPMPGTLLRRHPQSQQDFVAVDQWVQAGDIVALVQVGPLYVPVRSPTNGTIRSLTAEHLSAVEYDEGILTLEPHRSP